MNKKSEFEGIILAAGLSSRMKDWKPEIKINDLPLIVHTAKPMLDHCKKVIIVGGYNFEKLQKIIFEENYLSSLQRESVYLVENKNYKDGMFSTVKAGLSETGNAEGVFLIPADIPFVKSSTYSKLKKSFDDSPDFELFIPTAKVESDNSPVTDMLRKGHPVLIRKEIINDILLHSNETSLHDVLEEFSCRYCQVNDQGIFWDIDDKSDLEKAKKYFAEPK